METKKENYMNQSLRKVLSHQEKEQNLLQQEAAFLLQLSCTEPAGSNPNPPRFHLLCLVGDLPLIIVLCSPLCSILWQSPDHLALLFGICSREWWTQDCEGPRGPSGLGLPTAEPHLLKVSVTDRTTSPEIQLVLQLPIFLLGSCSHPHHSGC